jgi:glycosyltransferase involved in cell wall biosynthesis
MEDLSSMGVDKVVFVHDHIFFEKSGLFYSNGSFPSSIWARYLKAFEKVHVVGRNGGSLDLSVHNFTLSSVEPVKFSLLPNMSNLKSLFFGNKTVSENCKKLVSECDGVIARLPSRMGQIFISEAIKQGKPYAVEVVGCAWDALWNHGNWKGKVVAPFAYYKTKKTVKAAPYALYVTQYFLQQRYPCRGKTTFCSNVEIAAVENNVLNQRNSKGGAVSEKIIFGMVGNYASKYKGIDIAIRALSLIDAELSDWEFQILGAGDSAEYAKLASKLGIGDKVKFIGSLPSGEPVYRWLDNLNIYLQPSLTEGLPRALVEAMSRGCPALGSRVGGIPELLQPEQMIKPGDYESLAAKIYQTVQDRALLEKLSEENFNKAKRYYKNILEERRTEFWFSFKQYIKEKN